MHQLTIILAFSIVLAGRPTFGQDCQSSVRMSTIGVGELVRIDGMLTLYYELHLSNIGGDSIALEKLEVLDSRDFSVVNTLSSPDLKKRYGEVVVSENDNKGILPPGGSGVIYLEVILAQDRPLKQITHVLEVMHSNKIEKGSCKSMGAVVDLVMNRVILGPPLSKGPWAAIYDPSWQRGHRRVIYTVDGQARIPGRYAIDFIQLNNQGHYSIGDDNQVENWYGYDEAVLAVGDGVIASTRNDFSESTTLSGHPEYSSEKATGNYVSLDLGNNHIAFYEHLKPGSIVVKSGQKVKKGDVIASVGFTGQTTGPHLHFHVADKNSPLGAEGIPFAFDHFKLLGSYADFNNFGKIRWTAVKDLDQLSISKERPGPNSVIEF